MSLRWRITAVAVLVAVLPTAALGLLLRNLTIESAHAEHAQRLSTTAESAARRVDERRNRERRALARLCEGDFLIDRLLLDLQAGRFGPFEQDELVQRVTPLMRSMGLAALVIGDGRRGERFGRVFAAGHFPGRAGATDADLLRAAEEAGERWFVQRLHVRNEGQTEEVQALITGCTAERGEARVVAVGGQVLDAQFVEALAGDVPPVHLVLTGADGVVPADFPARGARQEVYVFEDLAGRPAARLVAVVDDGPLQARIAEIDRRLVGTLAVALGVALLLGFTLALTITRPLRELEGAASRVASGDMSTLIQVKSGGEVGKALRAFNHMTAELNNAQSRLIRAERIAAWRDIARRIAHEIKNPLMPIQTSIETMRKTHARRHPDFDEIFEESTVTILEEVERLKHIVTEFSRFARLPRPQPIELAVEDVAAHVVGLHGSGDVRVTMEAQGALPRVRADREQLTQVLVNLVQNAADAARARHGANGAHVHVVVSPADEGARVEVIDNGTGIPPSERARIFEPYYTTKSSGTGLGLAIVHRIVSDHGGRIDVDDAEGGGAVFEIVLPREGPPPELEGSQTDGAVPLVRPRG
jgi:signal transduction histidine kinase